MFSIPASIALKMLLTLAFFYKVLIEVGQVLVPTPKSSSTVGITKYDSLRTNTNIQEIIKYKAKAIIPVIYHF